jgi:hypothetical protein
MIFKFYLLVKCPENTDLVHQARYVSPRTVESESLACGVRRGVGPI